MPAPIVTAGETGAPTGRELRSGCRSGRIFSFRFCPGFHSARFAVRTPEAYSFPSTRL